MMRSKLRVVAASLFALALAVNVTMAAKIKAKQIPVPMPGVDGAGNLDFGLGAEGSAKLTYNSKTGRLHIVARGRVDNESGSRQKYNDVGILTGVGDVIKDDYTVQKNGRAVYQGLSRNVVI